jgi:phosphohistidine phosphatase
MNLILWRHAEAHELSLTGTDMDRALTPRGEKQAKRMGQWLDRQLPEGARVLVSPARRTEQTAMALGRKYKIRPELAPGCSVDQLLEVAQWSDDKATVLVVGHQPTLGHVIATLLGLSASACAVKRGAVWWLRSRERDGQLQTVVVTVQSPEVL